MRRDLGEKLAAVGLTRYELALRTGVSKPSVWRLFERNRSDVGGYPIDTIWRIHLATGGYISFDDFVDHGTKPKVERLISSRQAKPAPIARARARRTAT